MWLRIAIGYTVVSLVVALGAMVIGKSASISSLRDKLSISQKSETELLEALETAKATAALSARKFRTTEQELQDAKSAVQNAKDAADILRADLAAAIVAKAQTMSDLAAARRAVAEAEREGTLRDAELKVATERLVLAEDKVIALRREIASLPGAPAGPRAPQSAVSLDGGQETTAGSKLPAASGSAAATPGAPVDLVPLEVEASSARAAGSDVPRDQANGVTSAGASSSFATSPTPVKPDVSSPRVVTLEHQDTVDGKSSDAVTKPQPPVPAIKPIVKKKASADKSGQTRSAVKKKADPKSSESSSFSYGF